MSKIVTYTLIGLAGLAFGYGLKDCNCDSDQIIKAEGFPRGYHIEKVEIPTRGKIIRVKNLVQTSPAKGAAYISITGPFEYEIQPLNDARPKEDHSDIYGNTDDSRNYWIDTREGTVTLHKDNLEDKLKK